MEKANRIKKCLAIKCNRSTGFKKRTGKRFTEQEGKIAPETWRKPFFPTVMSTFQKADVFPARRHHLTVEWDADSLCGFFLPFPSFLSCNEASVISLLPSPKLWRTLDITLYQQSELFVRMTSVFEIGNPASVHGNPHIRWAKNPMHLETSNLDHEYLK